MTIKQKFLNNYASLHAEPQSMTDPTDDFVGDCGDFSRKPMAAPGF